MIASDKKRTQHLYQLQRYSSAKDEETTLFTEMDWFQIKKNRLGALAQDINNIDSEQLLNTSTNDLAEHYADKYRVNCPELGEPVTSTQEMIIDIRNEWDHPHSTDYVGMIVRVEIPFSGEASAFKCMASMHSSYHPRAKVDSNALSFLIRTNVSKEQIKSEIDNRVVSINRHLGWLKSDIQKYNEELFAVATHKIANRKNMLLEAKSLAANLGYKVKPRHGQGLTYPAPTVRRKIHTAVPKPTASQNPYKPEPALEQKDYEHILSVLNNMAKVMELNPSTFSKIKEEALRDHFLVQLNGHFQGGATGETFNYEGKTDILIKEKGRNIFIAECKFWTGEKGHTKALDQILSYTSWRDTKVALIVFNKNKDFSSVLEKIKTSTAEHPKCKKMVKQNSDTSWTYLFAHKDDPNRELTLTVLAFEVPK